MNDMSDRQSTDQKHLASLRGYWKAYRSFPAMAKLAAVMGLASGGSAFQALNRLIEKGFLHRIDGRIAPTERFFSRTLFSSGGSRPQKTAPYENLETISVDDFLVRHPDRTALLPVNSDSMNAAALLEGDIAVVELNTRAKLGDIVAATVGGSIVIQWLDFQNGEYVLKPANPTHSVQRLGSDFVALGVVVGSFRNFTVKLQPGLDPVARTAGDSNLNSDR